MGIRNNPKLDEKSLWEYALRVLSQRAHSAGEIRQKLLKRAQSAADLEAVLAKLREYEMVDDRRFSEAFAAARLQNDGFGRYRILNDLRRTRVSASVAEGAVNRAFTGTDEQQLIERYLTRKYRNVDLTQFLKEEKNLASAYRRLRTAGFSSGSAVAALKRYSQRVEEFSEPPED
ncbi:MAG TPA: regulatory protein RecX [Bryobacteraceae bacterium]